MEKVIRIGMDTSKRFFQLHGVDAAEQPVLRKQLTRAQVLPAACCSFVFAGTKRMVALANKMARIAWKLMVSGESYVRGMPQGTTLAVLAAA